MVRRNQKYEVPTFHPTLRDIGGSFEAYITSIERRFAKYGLNSSTLFSFPYKVPSSLALNHWFYCPCSVGICKIIAPKGWTPRAAGYENLDHAIPRPIRQHATGRRGVYRMLNEGRRAMSLARDFEPIATGDDSLPPSSEDAEAVERRFWRNVTLRPPLYGADVPGSLCDEDLKVRRGVVDVRVGAGEHRAPCLVRV